MKLVPSLDTVVDSVANGFDLAIGHGPADVSPTPSSIIDQGPQRLIRRYRPPRRRRARDRAPVLLVPPLAAPATCFDLRRGCSVAEHLLSLGHPTYLVDYGPISFGDRVLGLEHWVEDVIPAAIDVVSDDAGAPVQPVGWCLGGIMTLLAVAADRRLPVASVAMIGSPFDFARVRMMAPVRQLARLTGGALGTALYRMLGGAPAGLVSLGFRLTAIDRYLTKPLFWPATARPRDAGPRPGGRQLHGQHARLPRAHLRPALPRLLPRERPRRTAGSSSAIATSTFTT